jgi:RadC-like JAB domain
MQPRMVTRLHEIFDEAVQRGILRESEAHNAHIQLDRMEAKGFTGEPTRRPEPRLQPVVKPATTPRTPTISPAARARMAEVKEALAHEPVEHAIVWGVRRDGSLAFEVSSSQGLHNRVQADWSDMVQRARMSESVGICTTHNHPLGTSPEWTDADSLATTQLARYLKEHNLELLACDHVTPPPEASRHMPTSLLESAYAWREAEERRLWAPYGGERPAWARGGR